MNTLRLPLLLTLTAAALVGPAGCDSDSEEITATASDTQATGNETSGSTESGETSPTSTATTQDSNSESATDSATSGSDTDATSTSDTQDSNSSDTDSGDTDSGDTDSAVDCESARTEAECQDTEFYDCQWFPTTTVALDNKNACGDLGFEEGLCTSVDQLDSGCPVDFIPTCDDGRTVFHRALGLEVGAVELVAIEQDTICGVPDGFEQCQVSSDPGDTEPSYFPLECGCMCDDA